MVRHLSTLCLTGLCALSFYLFYEQYFRWRGCFNDEGRCFDPQTGLVYHAQSGLFWALLCAVFGAATLYFFLTAPKK